ncbi:MAG: 30S ribosomal protein S6 [Bacteroidia bacterium]|nr:30S ribosomal protein S6 [Bacteroidia bacterium]
MANTYESVFILTPVLSDDQAKEAAKKIKKKLSELKAKVVHEEHWGMRKLAYPIQKKTTGFYHLFEFTSDRSDIVTQWETLLKRDERVIRYLTVKLDKDALEYAQKRKAKIAEAKKDQNTVKSRPKKQTKKEAEELED